MIRRPAMVCFLLAIVLASASAQAQPKPSSDVLIPYFEVDLEGGSATTVFAVANALNQPVDASVTVYTNWGIPVLSAPVKLAAHEIWTANLRDWLVAGNLSGKGRISASQLDGLQAELSGQASPDDGLYYSTAVAPGRAAGYITIRTVRAQKPKGGKSNRPDALRGESFLVDPEEGPARGQDLTDIDPATATRICFRQSVRHRSGTGLGDGRLILWRDMAAQVLPAPVAADRSRQVDVSVFSAAGKLLRTQQIRLLPIEQVTFARLGLTEPLGRIEIATADPSVAGVLASENGPVVEASCASSGPGPGNQPQVRIVTLVNGQDANSAPGPKIPVGSTVTWQYQVSNTGAGALKEVRVTDDQGIAVSCPKNTLSQGQSMTCTAKAPAVVCQHRNTGTVTAVSTGKGKKRTTVTSQDPANYFGDEGAAIEIVVSTNGQDANAPEGPHLQSGSRVDWSYLVRNTGTLRLYEVAVKDDHNVPVDCPRVSLAPGEPMTCAANGIAGPGQYRNVGTATAKGTCGPITDDDVSHYFGESETDLQVRVLTNGYDGDFPPGPSIPVDSPVTWEYLVTNTGKLDLNGLQATNDRNVAASCPATLLAPGKSMTCRAQGVAAACQQSFFASVSGRTSEGQPVSASDQSHYFGGFQAAVAVEMSINGSDADLPPGPSVVIGGAVQWSYMVTNTGKAPLTGVQVTDDKGAAVACPRSELRAGESMTCSAGGVAVSGDFRNVATVTGQPPCGSAVTASDPSHYHGAGDPGVRIQTKTNGDDANVPPGPSIPIGNPVRWDYVVTNTGQLGLDTIAVADSRGAGVTCPKAALRAGESMTCLGTGVARACQYDTLGTVTARTPDNRQLTAVDPSYYYGQAAASVRIETATNGIDADTEPGPTIRVGSTVTWTYAVTNDGNVDLANVQVADDQGALVVCPKTTLPSGETMACHAQGVAVEGRYGNTGTVTASPPCGPRLTAQDPSHYFGHGSGALEIRNFTNGEDANEPPGPTIPVGDPVTWTYRVTNTGTVTLSAVGVTDSRGVAVICPRAILEPAEVMTCLATGRAQACQYGNLGIATGRTADGQQINAVDPSYYFGASQAAVAIEARVDGQEAGSPPGPSLTVGAPVSWTYAVTNQGAAPLANVRVTDESGMLVSCPKTALQPGELMTCAASGTAREGLVRNGATVKADPPCGSQISAQDATWYTGGSASALQIRKLVNGQEAPQAPGPSIPVGTPIVWTYIVANSGPVPLAGVAVTDDDPSLTVTCPKSTLQPDETITCTSSRGTARACSYVNIGKATAQSPSGPISASVPSFYYGSFQAGVRIETMVNGKDADAPPGDYVQGGSTVSWTYLVTNTSPVTLTNVLVRDDQGVTVSCPSSTLAASQSMTCQASGPASTGQSLNTGIVTGNPPCGDQVTAQDPAYYFGTLPVSIDIEKFTNGQDVAQPSALLVLVGSAVEWKYNVENTGQAPLTGVLVSDDKGVKVTCPKTALQPGELMTCTGSGTAIDGDYTNTGSAVAQTPYGGTVNDSDQSHYRGANASIDIETRTAGQEDDDPVWGVPLTAFVVYQRDYTVTNPGPFNLAGVQVTDSSGLAVNCHGVTTLAAGASMSCVAYVTAQCGFHAATSKATATSTAGETVTDSDPNNYRATHFLYCP